MYSFYLSNYSYLASYLATQYSYSCEVAGTLVLGTFWKFLRGAKNTMVLGTLVLSVFRKSYGTQVLGTF